MIGSAYTIDVDTKFYVKKTNENGNSKIYRMWFTAFEGGSTGNITFKFEDMTESLGYEDVSNEFSFGMYPNPSLDKKVTFVYENNGLNNSVAIFTIDGKQVYNTKLAQSNGFYKQTLDLNQLASGLYIVKVKSGNKTMTKKLILK